MLKKTGNSNSSERIDLLDKFRHIFPDAQIAYVCGDREFIGKKWLSYLMLEPVISFKLRIKSNNKIGCVYVLYHINLAVVRNIYILILSG